MKKYILIILILMIGLTVVSTGCNKDDVAWIFEERIGENMLKELMGYLSEKDADGIKSMLRPEILSLHATNGQIERALDFFDGKVVSYGNMSVSSGGGMDKGKVTHLDISPVVRDVITDTNKTYIISMYGYLVYADNRDKEGISIIGITDENGNEMKIGRYID